MIVPWQDCNYRWYLNLKDNIHNAAGPDISCDIVLKTSYRGIIVLYILCKVRRTRITEQS